MSELCWVVSFFNELTDPGFKLGEWDKRLQENKVVAIAKEDSRDTLKEFLCIVDAKALYDHLSKKPVGPSHDKCTSLEIQVVRQNMNSIKGHCSMIVDGDGLTEKFGNMAALYDLLSTGGCQIVNEVLALEVE